MLIVGLGLLFPAMYEKSVFLKIASFSGLFSAAILEAGARYAQAMQDTQFRDRSIQIPISG